MKLSEGMVLCETCDGTGVVPRIRPYVMQNGFWCTEKSCPACHGLGEVEEEALIAACREATNG